MSDIVEHPDAREPQVLHVGDNNQPVSFKTYQDIYHQITGRTEQIRKRYSDHLLLGFSEIEQLHYKITQLCDVHHVVARNESVTVFLDKERKEQFSSFESFRSRYNASATTPCVSVVMKYDFALTPSGLPKPQRYSVTARLTSRVAALKQAEEDVPPFIRSRVANFITNNTAEVTVEYADYVVARGFTEAFDEWVRGCPATPPRGWVERLQRCSHWFSPVLRAALASFAALFATQAAGAYLQDAGFAEAARFGVIFAAGAYLLVLAAGTLGRLMEDTIDSYPMLSYLRLNRGDDRLIEEFRQRRRGIVWRTVGGGLATVGLGVLSGCIERLL